MVSQLAPQLSKSDVRPPNLSNPVYTQRATTLNPGRKYKMEEWNTYQPDATKQKKRTTHQEFHEQARNSKKQT